MFFPKSQWKDWARDWGLSHRAPKGWLAATPERIAGERPLQANGRGDITRIHALHIFALVGMHAQQTPNPFPHPFGRIQNMIANMQHA